MHIITRKRLNDFAGRQPEARSALTHWYHEMKRRNFASLAEVRAVIPSADRVGKLTVFNIGGNKARLIAAIHYNAPGVYSGCTDPSGIRRGKMEGMSHEPERS